MQQWLDGTPYPRPLPKEAAVTTNWRDRKSLRRPAVASETKSLALYVICGGTRLWSKMLDRIVDELLFPRWLLAAPCT